MKNIIIKQNLEPPDLYDVRTSFRVAQGTKSFKLSCPIKPESAGGQEDNNVMVRWKKDGEEVKYCYFNDLSRTITIALK